MRTLAEKNNCLTGTTIQPKERILFPYYFPHYWYNLVLQCPVLSFFVIHWYIQKDKTLSSHHLSVDNCVLILQTGNRRKLLRHNKDDDYRFVTLFPIKNSTHFFPVVLFIMLITVVHSISFESVGRILISMIIQWKLLSSASVWFCLICCTFWFTLWLLSLGMKS